MLIGKRHFTEEAEKCNFHKRNVNSLHCFSLNCAPCTETLQPFHYRGKCFWRSPSLELPRAISGLYVYLWQQFSSNSVNRKLIITFSLLWFRFSTLKETLQNHTPLSLASLHLLLPAAVGWSWELETP